MGGIIAIECALDLPTVVCTKTCPPQVSCWNSTKRLVGPGCDKEVRSRTRLHTHTRLALLRRQRAPIPYVCGTAAAHRWAGSARRRRRLAGWRRASRPSASAWWTSMARTTSTLQVRTACAHGAMQMRGAVQLVYCVRNVGEQQLYRMCRHARLLPSYNCASRKSQRQHRTVPQSRGGSF